MPGREGGRGQEEARHGAGSRLGLLPRDPEDSVSFSSGKTPKSRGGAGGTYARPALDELGRHLRPEPRGAGRGRRVQGGRRPQKAPGGTGGAEPGVRGAAARSDRRSAGDARFSSCSAGQCARGGGVAGGHGGAGRPAWCQDAGHALTGLRGDRAGEWVCVMTSSATEMRTGGTRQGQTTQAPTRASGPPGECLKVTVLTPRREDSAAGR